MPKKIDINQVEPKTKSSTNNNTTKNKESVNSNNNTNSNTELYPYETVVQAYDKLVGIIGGLSSSKTGQEIVKGSKKILTGAAVQMLTKKGGIKGAVTGAVVSKAAEVVIDNSNELLAKGKQFIREFTADPLDKTDLIILTKSLTTSEKYKNNELISKLAAFLISASVKEDITTGKSSQWLSIIDCAVSLQENGMTNKEIEPVMARMLKAKVSQQAHDSFIKHFKVKIESNNIKHQLSKKRVSKPVAKRSKPTLKV